MWHRVFLRGDNPLPPAELLQFLQDHGMSVEAHFKGDDLGWTSAELQLGGGASLNLERYLTKEDNLRDDLNSWAAFLETCNDCPNHPMLMERVIQSLQMITLHHPIDLAEDARVERVCREICQYLATTADGVYQIDDEGWFAADGSLLLQEH